MNDFVVVWCDSPLGLISVRIDSRGNPVIYNKAELPNTVAVPEDLTEIFAILSKRDGTLVAVPANSLNLTFGWKTRG